MESRVNPAPFAVERLSAPMGDHGNSVAFVVGGGLTINPAHDLGGGQPVAYLDAANPVEAIKLALAGSVTVDLAPVGKPLTTYTYQPSTVGNGPPLPFRIVPAAVPPPAPPAPPGGPTPTGDAVAVTEGGSQANASQASLWKVQLEDLAAYPQQSDYDYDDTTWTVRVTNALPPTVTVEALPPGNPVAVAEGGSFGVKVQRANGLLSQPLTVPFALGVSAPNDWPATWQADYTVTGPGVAFNATGGTVTFAAGQTEVVLTVAAAADAVPEPDESVRLSVAAGSGQPGYGQGVNVRITDVAPPPVAESQSLTVSKGLPAGALVGTVRASTTDPRLTLTYSVTSGNTGGAFALNTADGTLTVANPAALAANSAFTLTVRVADNSTPAQTATATISMDMVDDPAPSDARANTIELNRRYVNIQNYLNGGLIDNSPRLNGNSVGLNPANALSPTRKTLDLLAEINGHVDGMQAGLNFATDPENWDLPVADLLTLYRFWEEKITLPMLNMSLKLWNVVQDADRLLQQAYSAVKESEKDSFRVNGLKRQLTDMESYLRQVRVAANAITNRLGAFAAPLDNLDLQLSLEDMPRRVYMTNLQIGSAYLTLRINEVSKVLAVAGTLSQPTDAGITGLNGLSVVIHGLNAEMDDTDTNTDLGYSVSIADALQRLMVGVAASGGNPAQPGLQGLISQPGQFGIVRGLYLNQRDYLVGLDDDPTDLVNGYGAAGHVLSDADALLDAVSRETPTDPGVLTRTQAIATSLGVGDPVVRLQDKFRLRGIDSDLEYLHSRLTVFLNEADTLIQQMTTLRQQLLDASSGHLFSDQRGSTSTVIEQFQVLYTQIDGRRMSIENQRAVIATRMAE